MKRCLEITIIKMFYFSKMDYRLLSGKYPQVQGNIATTKLIQWETAEMRGNKPFHGFGGFIFLLFEPFFVSVKSPALL